ncbi:hypothetical protein Barb4_00612 [Bacteroidales bacterium Barb4]|nr:hypothetical protein Barb4_00612 [Bacteroidales bacterium Barb4]
MLCHLKGHFQAWFGVTNKGFLTVAKRSMASSKRITASSARLTASSARRKASSMSVWLSSLKNEKQPGKYCFVPNYIEPTLKVLLLHPIYTHQSATTNETAKDYQVHNQSRKRLS